MEVTHRRERDIKLPDPPKVKWQTEEDVYRYLSTNAAIRQIIINTAAPKLTNPHGCVWAHHPLLFFPLPIYADNTENRLLNEVNARLGPAEPPVDHASVDRLLRYGTK